MTAIAPAEQSAPPTGDRRLLPGVFTVMGLAPLTSDKAAVRKSSPTPERKHVPMRTMPQFLRRTLPVALGGAFTIAVLSTAPASASSGWWFSQGKGAEGFYNHVNGRVYANDIKKDGYFAVTQILTYPKGYVVTSVNDTGSNNGSTWRTPNLYQGGDYMIRVCVAKYGQKATKCSASHWFEA